LNSTDDDKYLVGHNVTTHVFNIVGIEQINTTYTHAITL